MLTTTRCASGTQGACRRTPHNAGEPPRSGGSPARGKSGLLSQQFSAKMEKGGGSLPVNRLQVLRNCEQRAQRHSHSMRKAFKYIQRRILVAVLNVTHIALRQAGSLRDLVKRQATLEPHFRKSVPQQLSQVPHCSQGRSPLSRLRFRTPGTSLPGVQPYLFIAYLPAKHTTNTAKHPSPPGTVECASPLPLQGANVVDTYKSSSIILLTLTTDTQWPGPRHVVSGLHHNFYCHGITI
ncbi:MAG: hypothetical protein JWN15_3367 [Firmicutes bacterium]|nr:hypothetical protein [Bacillota bacterium]